jgi:hypothetical protein
VDATFYVHINHLIDDMLGRRIDSVEVKNGCIMDEVIDLAKCTEPRFHGNPTILSFRNITRYGEEAPSGLSIRTTANVLGRFFEALRIPAHGDDHSPEGPNLSGELLANAQTCARNEHHTAAVLIVPSHQEQI